MPSFTKSKILSYPIELVSEVITDIEEYPNFLPWCKNTIILDTTDGHITAQMDISFQQITESYVSRTTISRTEQSVKILSKAISGPFSHLISTWRLESADNATKINFSIDFSFKSKILDVVMGVIFHNAAKKMVAAFEERVKKLHNEVL